MANADGACLSENGPSNYPWQCGESGTEARILLIDSTSPSHSLISSLFTPFPSCLALRKVIKGAVHSLGMQVLHQPIHTLIACSDHWLNQL